MRHARERIANECSYTDDDDDDDDDDYDDDDMCMSVIAFNQLTSVK